MGAEKLFLFRCNAGARSQAKAFPLKVDTEETKSFKNKVFYQDAVFDNLLVFDNLQFHAGNRAPVRQCEVGFHSFFVLGPCSSFLSDAVYAFNDKTLFPTAVAVKIHDVEASWCRALCVVSPPVFRFFSGLLNSRFLFFPFFIAGV